MYLVMVVGVTAAWMLLVVGVQAAGAGRRSRPPARG